MPVEKKETKNSLKMMKINYNNLKILKKKSVKEE